MSGCIATVKIEHMNRIVALLLLASPLASFAQGSDPNLGIIPAPVSVTKGKG